MHKHAVRTCKHELQICAECGDVYCLKCNKEWYKERTYSLNPYIYPYTVTTGTTYISGTNIIDADPVLPSHTHVQ